jgi:hypothetical protein
MGFEESAARIKLLKGIQKLEEGITFATVESRADVVIGHRKAPATEEISDGLFLRFGKAGLFWHESLILSVDG